MWDRCLGKKFRIPHPERDAVEWLTEYRLPVPSTRLGRASLHPPPENMQRQPLHSGDDQAPNHSCGHSNLLSSFFLPRVSLASRPAKVHRHSNLVLYCTFNVRGIDWAVEPEVALSVRV